jgi:hypothetical protein
MGSKPFGERPPKREVIRHQAKDLHRMSCFGEPVSRYPKPRDAKPLHIEWKKQLRHRHCPRRCPSRVAGQLSIRQETNRDSTSASLQRTLPETRTSVNVSRGRRPPGFAMARPDPLFSRPKCVATTKTNLSIIRVHGHRVEFPVIVCHPLVILRICPLNGLVLSSTT